MLSWPPDQSPPDCLTHQHSLLYVMQPLTCICFGLESVTIVSTWMSFFVLVGLLVCFPVTNNVCQKVELYCLFSDCGVQQFNFLSFVHTCKKPDNNILVAKRQEYMQIAIANPGKHKRRLKRFTNSKFDF